MQVYNFKNEKENNSPLPLVTTSRLMCAKHWFHVGDVYTTNADVFRPRVGSVRSYHNNDIQVVNQFKNYVVDFDLRFPIYFLRTWSR